MVSTIFFWFFWLFVFIPVIAWVLGLIIPPTGISLAGFNLAGKETPATPTNSLPVADSTNSEANPAKTSP